MVCLTNQQDRLIRLTSTEEAGGRANAPAPPATTASLLSVAVGGAHTRHLSCVVAVQLLPPGQPVSIIGDDLDSGA